jgi:hypothetical protein
MKLPGTNSVSNWSSPEDSFAGTTGRLGVPLLGAVLAIMAARTCDESAAVTAQSSPWPSWTSVSYAGGGTARSIAKPHNQFKPQNDLGRRLIELRRRAIANGMNLVPMTTIVENLERFRE